METGERLDGWFDDHLSRLCFVGGVGGGSKTNANLGEEKKVETTKISSDVGIIGCHFFSSIPRLPV